MLFNRDIKTIGKHINNVFNEGELDKVSTVAKFATVRQEGAREITRNIEHYNLDVIISVGYRVKSKQGTQFRIWANKVIQNYLIKGYALNEKRLQEKVQQFEELKQLVHIQQKVISDYVLNTDEAQGLVNVLNNYTTALEMLDDYDHQRLLLPEKGGKEVFRINYNEAREAINKMGKQAGFEGLFGIEKDDSFKGSLENIYQTFEGKDLYPTTEEKAAHLLYFVTKNHSFTDGNKRIAASLFIWFLDRNQLLLTGIGQKVISDSALVALILMIAESRPEEKDMIIKVVVNILLNHE